MPKALPAFFSLALSLTAPGLSGAASDPDGPGNRLGAVSIPARDAPPAELPRPAPESPSRFRETLLELEQSTTTQTLGVGRDYQSRNPTYDVSLVFRPRLYLLDRGDELETLSLRAVLAVVHELTNSDATTDRGETSFTDLDLWNSYTTRFWKRGAYFTEFGLRLPWLTIPTSKFSYRSGRILGLGTFASLSQALPLLDSEGDLLETLILRVGAGYSYGFSRAIVPSNADFARVRMDPDGRSLPADQLNGAALAQHTAMFRFITELFITERLKFTNDLIVRPAWKYALPRTELCGVVDTGCIEPRGLEDSTRHAVITEYEAELEYQVVDQFAVALGYANLALQLGPDGRRRSPFYSPDARFLLTLRANLDKIVAPARPDPVLRRANAGHPPSSH